MKQPTAPRLSEHLLREAARFLLYPEQQRRTRTNVRAQRLVDDALRKFVHWRTTLTPTAVGDLHEVLKPALLDELYCRDLLRAIPEIVERTRALATLTFEGISDKESFVYLKEAANCYLFGLPSAAVALARAAVETALRKKCSARFGKQSTDAAKLNQLIEDAAKGRLLSRDAVAGARSASAASRLRGRVGRRRGCASRHPRTFAAPSVKSMSSRPPAMGNSH